MSQSVFIIPIEGLTVTSTWNLGAVRVDPWSAIEELLAEKLSSAAQRPLYTSFATQATELPSAAFAQVEADTFDAAFAAVSNAVDVLRVFAQSRQICETHGMFGLPGDVRRSRIVYARLGEDVGFGYRFFGRVPGWQLDDEALSDFTTSTAFQFAANAVGEPRPSDGAQRALSGIELLSQAVLSDRPATKLIGVVQALEAMLLPVKAKRPRLSLARYVAFFGCGSVEGDLCGRQRDTCPYLALDAPAMQDELNDRKQRGETDGWLCSEWDQAREWYGLRNAVAHGDIRPVTTKQSDTAKYWVLHYLLEPILNWLQLHPATPVKDLEAAVASLPAPPDWFSAEPDQA